MISPVLYVADVERSFAFYTEKLGAMPGGKCIGNDGKTICAVVQLGGARVSFQAAPPGQQPYSPMEFQVNLDPEVNMQRLYTDLRIRGVFMFHDLEESAWDERMFGVKDPDGFRWRFVSRMPNFRFNEVA